jgi:hypothetical protein
MLNSGSVPCRFLVFGFVIPAQAGIQCRDLGSRLRGNDGQPQLQTLTRHAGPGVIESQIDENIRPSRCAVRRFIFAESGHMISVLHGATLAAEIAGNENGIQIPAVSAGVSFGLFPGSGKIVNYV